MLFKHTIIIASSFLSMKLISQDKQDLKWIYKREKKVISESRSVQGCHVKQSKPGFYW